jgi:PAS domain S-box-containing protein
MRNTGNKDFYARFAASALLLFMVLHVAAGFAAPVAARSGLDKVSLRLKWKHQFQFAGYYAAVAQGYYRDAGLDVTLEEDDPNEESVQSVVSGRAHFGVGGAELLLHRAQGKPVVVLAAIYQHSPLVFLVPATSDITNVHQLAGKRVMLEKHSAELLAYLRAEGLSREDLEILPHTYGVNELLAGKADAISAYLSDEPFNIVERNLDYRVFLPQSSGIDFYGDVLFTSEDQIKENPRRVADFISASKKGWKYALEHPEEIADLILSKYSTRHSRAHLLFEAEKSRKLIGMDVVEIGYMNLGRWQHIADKYHELGMLPANVELAGFVYSPQHGQVAFWRTLVQLGEIVFALVALFFVLKLIRSHFNLEELNRKNRIANRRLKKSRRRYSMLISSMPGMAYKCYIDQNWTMQYVSHGCLALTGYRPGDFIKSPVVDYFTLIFEEDRARVKSEILGAISMGQPFNTTYRITDIAGRQKWVWEQGRLSVERKSHGSTFSIEGFITDVSIAKNLEDEKQHVIADLQQALSEIKTLRGIIPICASCKKIRDDKGLWNQVEQYIKQHTDSEFSHSICPECSEKLYPQQRKVQP